MTVTFKVNSRWPEESIAKRLSRIVTASDWDPISKNTGYKWQLNWGNDWHMNYDAEKSEVTLRYRYASGDMLKGMKQFLEFIFA